MRRAGLPPSAGLVPPFDRRRAALWALALLGLAIVLVSIGRGAIAIPIARIFEIFGALLGLGGDSGSGGETAIVLQIRAPRTVMGFAVGGALALAGAAMQGLFRNPLADPTLIGASSGGALAAVAVIVLGGALMGPLGSLGRALALPAVAFAGALAATLLVYRFASRHGETSVATMLLAGIGVAAIANAGIGILIFVSDDDQLRTLNFWLLGSLAGGNWTLVLPVLGFLALPIVLLPRYAAGLNAFALGEAEAGHLGYDVEQLKRRLIVLSALAAGASVAVAGIIGFVGLVVPHLVRLALGADHRLVMPAAALLGGSLLVAADILARTLVIPAELPIGIVTSLAGGPVFLWLLLRRRRGL
jgi:iron complex transport system permease protein